MRFIVFVLAMFTATFAASAQEQWKIKKLDASSLPAEIVRETRALGNAGIADGLLETYSGKGDIVEAWYSQPTTRYQHGILGDAVEAGTLRVKTARGQKLSVILPKSEVFEDRYPRLSDLDGDGKIEVVTIRSSVTKGASVTIYGLSGNALVKKAATKFIGRSNRWLNIAGIAPFLGVKGKEITYVQTPHIGGTLFLLKYKKGTLVLLSAVKNFSNHVIGSRELRLSAIVDANGDGRLDLALPSANRRNLRIIGFNGKQLHEIGRAELPSPINKAIGVQNSGGKAVYTVGLENGEVYQIYR